MSQPSESSPNRRRRWYQYSLRTLLVVMTVAVGLVMAIRTFVEPYRRQRHTMRPIEDLGGTYQSTEAPRWLRRLFNDDFQTITLVNLADSDRPDEYVEQIASLPGLETLFVGGVNFTDDHLQRMQRQATLRRLVLDSTAVNPRALSGWREKSPDVRVVQSQRRAIAALREQHVLRSLDTVVDSGQEGWRDLLGEEHFERVVGVRFDVAGAVNLTHVRALPTVRRLLLIGVQIDDDLFHSLERLEQLEYLEVCWVALRDDSLRHLAGLRNLKTLVLSGTGIGDAGLAHLRDLRGIESLYLPYCNVTDAGLPSLHGLTKLSLLDLLDTQVTAEGAAELRKAMLACEIVGK